MVETACSIETSPARLNTYWRLLTEIWYLLQLEDLLKQMFCCNEDQLYTLHL